MMENVGTQSWANPIPLVKSNSGKCDIQVSLAVDLANPRLGYARAKRPRFQPD
jgi:hypothetical protein